MQFIRPLTKESQIATGSPGHEQVAGPFVASRAWSSGLRTLGLMLSLTLGWIVLFDPSLVRGVSLHLLAGFLSL
jgi:hypothetical protein